MQRNPLRHLLYGLKAALGDARIQTLLALTFTLIGVAAVFYSLVEKWSFVDALYFAVVTIATIGYGDFTPHTVIGKLFTIVYVMSGIGLFVTTAAAVAESLLKRRDDQKEEDGQ